MHRQIADADELATGVTAGGLQSRQQMSQLWLRNIKWSGEGDACLQLIINPAVENVLLDGTEDAVCTSIFMSVSPASGSANCILCHQ